MTVALELSTLPQSVRGCGLVEEVAIAEFDSNSQDLLEALTVKEFGFREALASQAPWRFVDSVIAVSANRRVILTSI